MGIKFSCGKSKQETHHNTENNKKNIEQLNERLERYQLTYLRRQVTKENICTK